MKDTNKKLPVNPDTDQFMFENTFPVVSSTECTGLVPAAPDSTAEVDGYTDIYDVPLAKEDTVLTEPEKRPTVFTDQIDHSYPNIRKK